MSQICQASQSATVAVVIQQSTPLLGGHLPCSSSGFSTGNTRRGAYAMVGACPVLYSTTYCAGMYIQANPVSKN